MPAAEQTTRREKHDSPIAQVRRLLVRQRRRLRLVRAAESAALCATVGALAAAAGELLWAVAGLSLRWHPGSGIWLLPVVIIATSAVGGAVVSLLRPLSLRAAARVTDARAGLRDRLATAAELIDSPRSDESVLRVVCEQALRDAERKGAGHVPLWSRGRSTAAALAVALLLAGALMPVAALSGRRGVSEQASVVRRMTPAEREQLAEAVRRLAGEAGLEETAPEIVEAQDAIREADADRLFSALADLRRAGVDVSALLRREPRAEDRVGHEAPHPSDVAESDTAGEPEPAAVRVYAPSRDDDGEPLESYSSAWSRAQSQAADALAAGRIPPRYRPLVRRYFAED